MTQYTLAFISLFSFLKLASQDKIVSIPINSVGDTTSYYQEAKDLIYAHKLNDLKETTYKVHLRIWTEKQITEIYYNEISNLTCFITHYTISKPTNNKKPKRYSQRTKLDPIKTTQLLQLIDSLGILNMPSEENIDCWGTYEGWKLVCKDGSRYFIESSNTNSYFFKTYTCPGTRNTCELEKQFYIFINKLEKYTESELTHSKFIKKLPKGYYYNGGIGMYTNLKKQADNKKNSR